MCALIAGNVASSEMIRVIEPFEIFKVPETADEDERKMIKFAKRSVPYYNPRAGYGYYEFSKPAFVLPERNVMALKRVCINKD